MGKQGRYIGIPPVIINNSVNAIFDISGHKWAGEAYGESGGECEGEGASDGGFHRVLFKDGGLAGGIDGGCVIFIHNRWGVYGRGGGRKAASFLFLAHFGSLWVRAG